MCDPISLTMGAVAIAGTVATYVGSQQQASAQNKANQQYSTAESQAVATNAISQYGQAQNQIQATDAQATQKATAEDMQEAAAAATAQTNASARGVTGNSVDAIQRDYVNRRDMFNADVEFNRKAADEEIVQQMKGIQNGATSQDNQIQSQNRFVQGQSPLQLVGGLANDGASAYTNYKQKQPITPQQQQQLSIPTTSVDYVAYDAQMNDDFGGNP